MSDEFQYVTNVVRLTLSVIYISNITVHITQEGVSRAEPCRTPPVLDCIQHTYTYPSHWRLPAPLVCPSSTPMQMLL